jgi:hypothetical protein
MNYDELHAIIDSRDIEYEAIVENKIEYSPIVITGVYFLLNGTEIVYVGQAYDVMSRIGLHRDEKKKEFNGYYIIECQKEHLNLVEAHFILKFKPLYNVTVPVQGVFKSTHQLKKILNANLWQIKNFIRINRIQDYNGYYRLSDFADFTASE